MAAKAEIRRLITAPGVRDGLGERVIAFDRPTGEVRDRLRVRPEIAAFETALGAQIDRVSRLTDPRFPRARCRSRSRHRAGRRGLRLRTGRATVGSSQ